MSTAQANNRALVMGTEKMSTLIPRMALPPIIAFLITSIYNLADTYFVSFIGTNATAAVSVNASLDNLIMMCGSTFAVGAASYSSRLLGANEKEIAQRTISSAFSMAFLFGLAIAILGLIFIHPLVNLLGATPTCEQYSVEYAEYVLLVAPFMATSFVMNQCLRSEGNALYSMIGMGFGGILNCILDPIFIVNMGLGVKGASIATAISKMVSFTILILPYLMKKTILKLSLKLWKPTTVILREIVIIGSSSFFRTGLSIVAGITVNNIAGNISDSALAAMGVTFKIMMFPFGVILGLGQGFQPVCGYNYGAKKYDRVKSSYSFASKFALIISISMGALLALFSRQCIGLFTVGDSEMVAIGSLSITAQSIALPIHAWVTIVNMFCTALGYGGKSFAIAISRQGTCFLPIVFPLAILFGSTGLALSQAIADFITLIIAIPILMKLKKTISEKERSCE